MSCALRITAISRTVATRSAAILYRPDTVRNPNTCLKNLSAMRVTNSTSTVAGVLDAVGVLVRSGRRLLSFLLVSAACGADALPEAPDTVRSASSGFLEALRQSFTLNHRLDQPVVLHEIDRVRRSPAYLERLSPRIERYLPAICSEAHARGMPAEICLLPIIESGVNPAAVSDSGARGLWQLVPGTAIRYGLKITWRADQRRDPVASTDAALRYLGDLQRRFRDWTLALAAYNCGETRVAQVLQHAADGASFFDLRWPAETAAYVPRLLAFAAIFADPAAHGISLPARLRQGEASITSRAASVGADATTTTTQPRTGLIYRPASSRKETNTEAIAR